MQEALEIARRLAGDTVRADADKWITVHPNGEGSTGTPALIGEDGTVKAGMGGKFDGKNIKDAHGTKNFTSGETNAETESRNKPQSSAKREYTPEHRAAQKAAQESVKALPSHAIEHYAKEQGISPDEAKKALLLEANQNSAKSAETVAKLSQVQKPVPQETPKPEYKQARHISEGIPEGQSKVSDPKYGDSHDMSIVWENENSYGIPDPNYMGSGYYAQHRWAKGENVSKSKYIFLPKSQVTIEGEGANRKIVAMSDWLAEQKGISTEGTNKKQSERDETEAAIQASANKRYDDLIAHAKANGIKGARSGMRTSTILDKYKEAGIEPPDSHKEGATPKAPESSEVKYHAIPGRGKGAILNVPFANKDEAKEAGARWSPDLKKWYFPEGSEFPKALEQWRMDSEVRADAETEPDYSEEEIAHMNRDNPSRRITGTVTPI